MTSQMKKLRKRKRNVLLKRRQKVAREQKRYRSVVDGLFENLSINDIHHRTGMNENSIRKIMRKNSEEITFLLLKRQVKKELKKK